MCKRLKRHKCWPQLGYRIDLRSSYLVQRFGMFFWTARIQIQRWRGGNEGNVWVRLWRLVACPGDRSSSVASLGYDMCGKDHPSAFTSLGLRLYPGRAQIATHSEGLSWCDPFSKLRGVRMRSISNFLMEELPLVTAENLQGIQGIQAPPSHCQSPQEASWRCWVLAEPEPEPGLLSVRIFRSLT